MKKFLFGVLIFLALFIAVPTSVHAVDVNNFVITDYDISYNLGRDQENRSILTTNEVITAEFPGFDQNRGIERFIPSEYDGHSTSLNITSVTKQDGTPWNYTTYKSGEFTVLRVGDADKYVQGTQTYIIEYKQRDVTKFYASTEADEFYWDTNGTDWRVPINSLNVTLDVDEELESNLNNDSYCYAGQIGSTASCELTKQDGTFTTSANNLAPGENVTIATGFNPGTFAEYSRSLGETILALWLLFQFLMILPAMIMFGYIVYKYNKFSERRGEIGTIIPEYLPPKGASVQVSGLMINSRSAFSAQLIDWAVRHYAKIYEVKPKSFFKRGQYEFEIIKPVDKLPAEEKELLTDLFGTLPSVGMKFNTKDIHNNHVVSSRFIDNPKKLKKLVRGEYNLRSKNPEKSAWFKRWNILLLPALLLLNIPLLGILLLTNILRFTLYPLTDKGLEVYSYLQGLKLYISVAETERLKMLQSPEGAAKVSVDTADSKQLIKLYEGVLPYAILFGQEKQWNKQLGVLYETSNTQPVWYAGHSGVFTAAAFSSAVSGLTTTVNSSAASSSASGGSSGGGSSGGGGGGGGGGGW